MLKNPFLRSIAAALMIGTIALFVAACGGTEQTATAASVDTTGATASTSGSATETGESGSIVMAGLVDYPMTFTALDMDYMDWTTVTADDPARGSSSFEGVLLSDIFSYVGVQPEAVTVAITGSDGSTAPVDLADISSDALLTAAEDYSLNTVMPGSASEAWVKDVVKMEFE